jgi:hypothetical protein
MFWDGQSYQRQYSVQRKNKSRTISKGLNLFTEADVHDDTDMPSTALDQWRETNPIAAVPWVYNGKKTTKKGGPSGATQQKNEKTLQAYQAQWEQLCSGTRS